MWLLRLQAKQQKEDEPVPKRRTVINISAVAATGGTIAPRAPLAQHTAMAARPMQQPAIPGPLSGAPLTRSHSFAKLFAVQVYKQPGHKHDATSKAAPLQSMPIKCPPCSSGQLVCTCSCG